MRSAWSVEFALGWRHPVIRRIPAAIAVIGTVTNLAPVVLWGLPTSWGPRVFGVGLLAAGVTLTLVGPALVFVLAGADLDRGTRSARLAVGSDPGIINMAQLGAALSGGLIAGIVSYVVTVSMSALGDLWRAIEPGIDASVRPPPASGGPALVLVGLGLTVTTWAATVALRSGTRAVLVLAGSSGIAITVLLLSAPGSLVHTAVIAHPAAAAWKLASHDPPYRIAFVGVQDSTAGLVLAAWTCILLVSLACSWRCPPRPAASK